MAAEAEEVARMEKIKRLSAEYEAELEATDGGALTEALAQEAKAGDPLRDRWHAYHLLNESDRRATHFCELMSSREADDAETAETNAAVAAAATAAAAEVAAASKAAAASNYYLS